MYTYLQLPYAVVCAADSSFLLIEIAWAVMATLPPQKKSWHMQHFELHSITALHCLQRWVATLLCRFTCYNKLPFGWIVPPTIKQPTNHPPKTTLPGFFRKGFCVHEKYNFLLFFAACKAILHFKLILVGFCFSGVAVVSWLRLWHFHLTAFY